LVHTQDISNSDKYNVIMSKAVDRVRAAQMKAFSIRPKVGGFAYIAEVLRQAGVTYNTWSLPSCQSVYDLEDGSVVQPGTPLVQDMSDVPHFDQDALIRSLRADQAGESTFPEFLRAAWEAGVIWYQVDFRSRKVTYKGVRGETYEESYPEVQV
jgi:uncharacterized protein YbcV (DUF1398 family)